MITFPSTSSLATLTCDPSDPHKKIHRSQSNIELGLHDVATLDDLDLFQDYLVDDPEDSIFVGPLSRPGHSTLSEELSLGQDILIPSTGRSRFNGIQRSQTDTAALKGLHQARLTGGRPSTSTTYCSLKRPHPESVHLLTDVHGESQSICSETTAIGLVQNSGGDGSTVSGEQGLTPWTGHEPEDELSQGVLRSGRVSKRIVKDEKEESGTSCRKFRTGSWSKDDSCIRSISSFFGRVRDLRKNHPCLLRQQPIPLPSRVNLTSKRLSQWLDKLADVTVPFQKSIRVIPRGLGGRTLLDQCLARKVPLARVIWLVRCTRLSELSASHETGLVTDVAHPHHREAWICEWTAAVQGFVDDQLHRESLMEHKLAVVYSLELVSQLFAYRLIADDQYLSWIIDRLGRSPDKALLFWLALAQVHKFSLSASVKRGNQLAAACSLRLSNLGGKKNDDRISSVRPPLQNFINDVLSSSPGCFVLASLWSTVRSVFENMISSDAKQVSPANLLHIMRTNDRLSLWTAQSETENHQSALRIMEILDAAMKPSPPEEASTACLSLMPDHFDLVMVVLTWACSKSRSSIAHIYVACRIFWTWTHQARFSVRACLVGATKALQHTSTLCPAAVGRLFAELTRSGHFDLSNYLRFAASARDPSKQRQPNKRQILLQAPTAHLPMEVQTLRTQLLASRSAVDSGKDNVSAIKGKIAASLNAAFAGNMPDLSAPKLQIMLDPIPAGVLFEIGKWLRGLLLPLLTKQPKDPEAVLAYQLVELVLLLMQNVNDFAQLRDIMSALASKSGTNSLYLIALFGEAHIDVLVALGHYNKLRHAILDRYRSLRASSAAPHRVLCQLLLQSTGTGVLGVEGEQYLLREIEFCDPGIAAYTPLNDMDVDTATDEQSDLDRLLAKGPALAGEELQSALNMILHHVFHLKSNAHAQVETIRCNLQALRTANEESFMPTLTGCIRAMSEELDDIAMLRLGSVLLIDDAMEVDDLAACIDGIVAANSEVDVEDRSPLIALHTLRFFCGGVATCEEPSTSSDDLFEEWSESPSDDWKRSVIRRRLEHAHPHILVRLVVHSLRVKPCGRAGLRSLVKTPSFHGLVHRLLREQEIGFNEEMQTLLRPTPSGTADNVRVFVAVIAELSEHLQHTPTPMTAGAAESMLRYLFASVEPASLQPYKLAMSWVTSCWRQGGPSLPDTSEICYSLCRDMSSRDAQLWQQLMPSVDPEVRRQMQARAEHAVLFSPESNDALRKCLRAQWDVSPTSHTRIFNAIKLNIQLNHRPEKAQLIARHLSIATRVNGENVADGPMFLDWLRAILQLVLIYHGSSTATSTLVSLLHSLCRLFTSTKLANHPDLASLAYDMACFFAPRANDSNLALLRAHLSDLFHDERIRFLLGHEPTPEPAFEQSSNFSSIASSPAVAPLGKHNAASPSQEPTSFGVRKCDSLSRPILDRDILDTAFRVWEDYDANDKR